MNMSSNEQLLSCQISFLRTTGFAKGCLSYFIRATRAVLIFRCSSLVKKIADRSEVPTSGPCRLSLRVFDREEADIPGLLEGFSEKLSLRREEVNASRWKPVQVTIALWNHSTLASRQVGEQLGDLVTFR